MRLTEVNNVGDLFSYCENYETSMDNYDIVKESYQLNLLEMALNVTDGSFLESEDDKEEAVKDFDKKKSNLIKRMIDALLTLLKKAKAAIKTAFTKEFWKSKMGKVTGAVEKVKTKLAANSEDGDKLTLKDVVARINNETQIITLAVTGKDNKITYKLNQKNDLIKSLPAGSAIKDLGRVLDRDNAADRINEAFESDQKWIEMTEQEVEDMKKYTQIAKEGAEDKRVNAAQWNAECNRVQKDIVKKNAETNALVKTIKALTSDMDIIIKKLGEHSK